MTQQRFNMQVDADGSFVISGTDRGLLRQAVDLLEGNPPEIAAADPEPPRQRYREGHRREQRKRQHFPRIRSAVGKFEWADREGGMYLRLRAGGTTYLLVGAFLVERIVDAKDRGAKIVKSPYAILINTTNGQAVLSTQVSTVLNADRPMSRKRMPAASVMALRKDLLPEVRRFAEDRGYELKRVSRHDGRPQLTLAEEILA